VFHYGNGLTSLAVVDITGHGIHAAMHAGLAKHALRAFASRGANAQDAVRALNRLCLENSTFEGNEEFFATVFFAIVDAERRLMQYVSAGHEAAYIVGPGGATHLAATGPLIGLMDDDSAFEHKVVQLSDGSIIAAVTDGFSEARNQNEEFLGTQAVVSVIERYRSYEAEQQAEALTRYAFDYAGQELRDDVAALVVKVLDQAGSTNTYATAARAVSTAFKIGDVNAGELAITVDRLQLALTEKQATVDALMKGFNKADFPVVDGLVFDVLYQPLAAIEQLGGDWYDVFTLPDGRIAFSLGDVCGRGPGSAVKMAQAKQAIHVAASLEINDPMPIAVLDQTNKVIFLNGNDVEFTTAIYGVIDVAHRTVTYASAGHCPPILVEPGENARILPNHGFPLGVEEDLPDLIREHVFTYKPGSMLVLYTDGLVEFGHDVPEGETRLLAACGDAVTCKAPHPARFIVEHVLQGAPTCPDDVAVVTISFLH
jgi:serine phosphatase RsbU (regulator of sigma subunit)